MDNSYASGETSELNIAHKMLDKLYKVDEENSELVDNVGNPWDQFFEYGEDRDARPFFNALKNIRHVPASSFIVTYLASEFNYPDNEEELKKLRSYAELHGSGADTTRAEGKDLFEKLEQRVRTRMRHIPELADKTEDGMWQKYYKECVCKPDFRHLRDIAFCFNMDAEDFETLLHKALRRSYLNFFEIEEIFTYVVLKYSGYSDGLRNDFELYEALKETYPVEDIQNDFCESFDGIRPDERGSMIIQNWIDDTFVGLIKIGCFNSYSESLHKHLAWVYKQSKSANYKRSAQLEYEAQLALLMAKHEEDLEFMKDIEEALPQEAVAEDAYENDDKVDLCTQKLTIKYRVEEEVKLSKGIGITAGSNINRGSVQAELALARDTVLHENKKRTTIAVSVIPITKSTNLDISFVKAKYVKDGFNIDSRQPGSLGYRVVEKDSGDRCELQVSPGKKLRFVGDSKESNGELIISCAPGTKILKGTIFGFEYEGIRYQYKVKDTVIAADYMTAELDVTWKNREELWNKKVAHSEKYQREVVVVESDSEFEIDINEKDYQGLCVLSVKNIKPLKISDPTAQLMVSGRKGSANFHKLKLHLYGKDPYEGLTSYGKNYILNQGFLKSTMVKSKDFPKDEFNRRNKLLTLIFLNFSHNLNRKYPWTDRHGESRTDAIINGFETECNRILDNCGLQRLYSGNVYDQFLRRLLVADDPYEMYRTLFSSEHSMTEYLKVDVQKKTEDWSWEVTRHLNDGTTESWGAGTEKAGNSLITLPRFIKRDTVKYTLSVKFKKDTATFMKDIELNEEQEAAIIIA